MPRKSAEQAFADSVGPVIPRSERPPIKPTIPAQFRDIFDQLFNPNRIEADMDRWWAEQFPELFGDPTNSRERFGGAGATGSWDDREGTGPYPVLIPGGPCWPSTYGDWTLLDTLQWSDWHPDSPADPPMDRVWTLSGKATYLTTSYCGITMHNCDVRSSAPNTCTPEPRRSKGDSVLLTSPLVTEANLGDDTTARSLYYGGIADPTPGGGGSGGAYAYALYVRDGNDTQPIPDPRPSDCTSGGGTSVTIFPEPDPNWPSEPDTEKPPRDEERNPPRSRDPWKVEFFFPPVPFLPPPVPFVTPRTPPRGRTKEAGKRKPLTTLRRIMKFIDTVSESAEVVNAVFEALPCEVQKKAMKKCRKEQRLFDNAGQFGIDRADCKAKAIWDNADKIDPALAVANVIRNEIEDQLYGKAAKAAGKGGLKASQLGSSYYNDYVDDGKFKGEDRGERLTPFNDVVQFLVGQASDLLGLPPAQECK